MTELLKDSLGHRDCLSKALHIAKARVESSNPFSRSSKYIEPLGKVLLAAHLRLVIGHAQSSPPMKL
jgi:hypothetical protein